MTNTRDQEQGEVAPFYRTPTQSQSADADAHRTALRGLGLASSPPRQDDEQQVSETDKMSQRLAAVDQQTQNAQRNVF